MLPKKNIGAITVMTAFLGLTLTHVLTAVVYYSYSRSGGTGEASSARDEAVAALVALGYNSSDAMKAVRKVLAENDSASGDTEMLLKLALKEMF